jgi:hypothetical protein
MKSVKLKTLLCVAGVLGVSALGVSVQAQGTNLLSLTANSTVSNVKNSIATYTFSGSMIVNSIGFYTGGATPAYLGWARNNGTFADLTNESYTTLDGFRWYTINESFVDTNTLQVKTTFAAVNNLREIQQQATGLNVLLTDFRDPLDVTPEGEWIGATNSNIRVSNPGSNIAPEPGTFALALTGGAALAGVGLRRRRKLG